MNVEIQGHRGDRGNFPENTIPAFLSAIKKGVDVIEMDVVISKDHQVVVSHEPFMSSLYMLQPNGEPISKENEKDFNLFQMNYSKPFRETHHILVYKVHLKHPNSISRFSKS